VDAKRGHGWLGSPWLARRSGPDAHAPAARE